MQLKDCISKVTVNPTTSIGSSMLASVVEHKVKGDVIKIKTEVKK